MGFRLIHTGDWHIGKPFGQFDDEKAPLLRAARASIVDRIGALARAENARTVLVAGDVFDDPMIADDVLRRLVARLEGFADLNWHFLPGNHDPATQNGIWQRFSRCVGPEGRNGHIVIHDQAGVRAIGEGVDLLAAPLHARAIAHDPTAWMTDRLSPDGTIRVGLAHGAVQGFGSANEASVLISPNRAVSAGLDYLALGDWHGARQAGPKAWYAGTPEPEQFPDNEPGYALSVTLDKAGAEPVVRRHLVGVYHWRRHLLEGDLMAALEDVERALSSGPVDPARMLLQFAFNGRLGIDAEIALREKVERIIDRVFSVEADYAGLSIADDGATPQTLADPLLAAVGARLAQRMTGSEAESAEVAHQALLLLAGFARVHGGPEGEAG